MDDILGLQLLTNHVIQLQSIWLYLQVTVLSKITNHSGTALTHTSINCPNTQVKNQSNDIQHSTLQWPHQPNPGPLAWKWWREVLSFLYLAPNTNNLQKPLGLWHPNHDTDFHWQWKICSCTQTLFQHKGAAWYAYQPLACRLDAWITYNNRMNLTSPPCNMVPATPTTTTLCIHIMLPIPGQLKPNPSIAQPTSIHTHLLTPPNCWADSLWHDIWPHAHLEMLHAQLLTTTRIIIVNNAAVHPDGSSTCAWIIWANSELWSSEGYVPGPPTDMYSGLAEAYRLYTGSPQLHPTILQLLPYYTKTAMHDPCILWQCDNCGVIDQTTCASPNTYPHDAISDDYPIYAEIWQTIKNLKLLIIQIHHVLGHQDKQKDCPLTLSEQLNIDCNAHASAMQPNPNPAQNKQNPANSAGYSHLCIRKQIIIRHLQHVLHNASQSPPYYDYLQNKFSWMTMPEMMVYWPTIQMALTQFT